jgi:hypothetical protein
MDGLQSPAEMHANEGMLAFSFALFVLVAIALVCTLPPFRVSAFSGDPPWCSQYSGYSAWNEVSGLPGR